MSLIESAYLKTLKKSKERLNEGAVTASDISGVAPPPIAETNESKKEVLSKKNISTMAQERCYSQNELRKRQLITNNSSLLNEYRNLRTKLIAGQSKPNFSTLVTSIAPDYDISLVVSNMAITFALDSRKTSLIVNADTKNVHLDNIFDISLELGVIDYLESDDFEIDKVLYETPVSRLRYIPSGSSLEGGSEHFTSNRMREFVKSLVDRYPERFPIISAPAVTISADARILADWCDCVVFVAPAFGKVPQATS